MKYIFGTLLSVYLLMIIGNINDPPPIDVPTPEIKAWKNPDPGREVDHFDENSLSYIYTDQMPQKQGHFEWKTPPLPDAYVEMMNGPYQTPRLKSRSRNYRTVQDELLIGKKRYRVQHRADHTQVLIPIR